MADEFIRRGLVRIELNEPTPLSRIGIYVLTERVEEARVAETAGCSPRTAARAVLPPL
jgi:hypothetical protein